LEPVLATSVEETGARGISQSVSVHRISYHGWSDCLHIENGLVEAMVVPAIGRVMQFRRIGDPEGPFWENRALDGRPQQPQTGEWSNYGGDKVWPAPQLAWPSQQGREWPPPEAFDAQPMEGILGEGSVTFVSAIDPALGIQVVRHIELEPGKPVLRIRTEFRKISGTPVQVSIWTIAQMRHPDRIGVQLSAQSRLADGYLRLMPAEPAHWKIEDHVLTLERHPDECVKIGADGASLAWIGTSCVVRIDVEAGPGEYPDGGCLTEVYTNPGELQYVELETLGPLEWMQAGEQIDRTTTYTILPRTDPDPEAEAQRVL